MFNRMATLKKSMLLLGVGGMAFGFGLSFTDLGCVRNSDLVTFYQGVGGASIAAFASTASGIGSDFDTIVVGPVERFFTGLWDNQVAQAFPLDLDPAAVLKQ